MDKKIAGLLGAVSALVTVNGASVAMAATPPTALDAQSYADLLQPIPNAVALLAASDAEKKGDSATAAGVQVAQYHHHHHHHYRRYHHHHHHHYHHHHYY